MKTTNYINTLIAIAEDSPTTTSVEPPERGSKPTIARRQYELLVTHPYHYTSDDVVFAIHADRAGIPEPDRQAERERFFAKSQACLRTSPLARRYGWGLHHDAEGRVAIIPTQSETYAQLRDDPEVTVVRAMRSKRR